MTRQYETVSSSQPGEEADLAELGDDRPVHLLGAVPVARVRRDLALAELAGGVADELLLGCQ